MATLPATVAEARVRGTCDLDVRPVLDKGGDPFNLIMKTARGLAADEALHLIVGFEPAPLYAVMKGMGYAAHTEQSDGTYHVWFYKASPGHGAPAAAPARGPAQDEHVPLQPEVYLDVRGLEPPQPMIRILEKLVELGPGARLRVHHHREPVLLYEKLALRGYAAKTTRRGEGDYWVQIAPAWALQGG